jgi:PPOX class probable F420-dependent enzyme
VPSWPPRPAERLAAARVGRLATVTAAGEPHVVPVCFAAAGGRLWTAVDAKPKATRALRRLENVRARGRASLLVDHYEEDWSRLWWIRVDGAAVVHETGPEADAALDALAAKYEPYRANRPAGPLIALTPERWRSWSAVPSRA